MVERKPIILCADDFAQDDAIGDGILHLVRAGRLSAVSCFTDGPLWPDYGSALIENSAQILIGLHFNLSFEFGFDERPLRYWIGRSLLDILDPAQLRSALQRQLDRFVAVAGRYPDYLDGHEHVHAFPVVRDVVRTMAASLLKRKLIRVRDVSNPVGATDAPLKRLAIRTMARARGGPAAVAPLNTAFAGDYSLSSRVPYGDLLANWLDHLPAGGLIMCHPRLAAPGARRTARDNEYELLASAKFLDLLALGNARLFRPSDSFAASPCSGGLAKSGTLRAATRRPQPAAPGEG